jgi:hypothetical protein
MKQERVVKVAAIAVAGLLLAAATGVGLWSVSATSRAVLAYQAERRGLDAAIAAAVQQGYSAADLAPITSRAGRLDAGAEPWWLPGRPGYFDGLATRAVTIRRDLVTLERQLVEQARSDGSRQSDAARAAVDQARQANAADPDVQALQQRLDTAASAVGAAHALKDYRAAATQAQGVARDAAALAANTQQENEQVAQAAQRLADQAGGLPAIHQAGSQAVAAANNDASLIAYLSKEGPFLGADTVARITSRLGKYTGLVGSDDVSQAALGVAGAQRYAARLHDALLAGMPAKAAIVSFQGQHVWAYEGSKVVMDSAVTTGIRGEGDYGTDFGPMKVTRKNHPWKFQSPWPKTSPYWYPDTTVQWTTFFTVTGEAFHDADWQPDSTLGPGSQFTAGLRSHGCIHVPAATAQWMFNWADVGMPVIVYPGDGKPVAEQLAQMTTNDQGIPHSAGG